MTKNSLAVAIEAMSWMAYAGIGERTALFKAADQLEVRDARDLRRAHKLIMESVRFQNRLDYFLSMILEENWIRGAPHGIANFLRILAYLRYVNRSAGPELEQVVAWARQILGWRELAPYEKAFGRIVYGREPAYESTLGESERIALETCNPAWLVEELIREFGRGLALRILRQNNSLPSTYFRLNPLRLPGQAHREKAAEQLRGAGVGNLEGVWRSARISTSLIRSKLFQEGGIVIQDLASIIASLVASAKPGYTVLDVCAAPGNKTSHLAAMMQNRGRIYSVDLSARRLLHWKSEMSRTGVLVAEPIRADAKKLPLSVETANVALVDPPCTNTGAFARNPAIKWKVDASDIANFASTQAAILQSASEHIVPGGIAVYCTCSILPRENEYVVQQFLRRNPDFRIVPQVPMIGSPGLRGFDLAQRFYTHIHDCNGYFIAKLERIP